MKVELTEERIIKNEPVKLKVPGFGEVLVREPTLGQQLEALAEARKSSYWNELNDLEKANEIARRLVVKAMVEPKLTYDDLLNLPLSVANSIVEVVSAYIYKVNSFLSEKRRREIEDFLGTETQG